MKSDCWLLLIASESSLDTHDLALPFPLQKQESYARVLVLSLANMDEAGLSTTQAQIQHFAAITEGQTRIITLILKEEAIEQTTLNGPQGFMHLQALCVLITIFPVYSLTYFLARLFESNVSCPFLPVPEVSSLLTTLNGYLKALQPASTPVPMQPMLTDLIAQTTASAPAKPLSEHDANVVTDIFPSLQEFENATRTQQGQAMLLDYLARTTVEDIIDFWADEWIL